MKRQRRSSQRRRGLRGLIASQPWAGPLLALALVVNGGALGYRLTEGWDWGRLLLDGADHPQHPWASAMSTHR